MKKLFSFICLLLPAVHSLAQTGNVGIGTTNPKAQLHTTGSLRFDTLSGNTGGYRPVYVNDSGNLVSPSNILQVFSNNNGYYIPDCDTNGAVSPITVTGMPMPAAGSNIQVRINISAGDADLVIYLISPSGQYLNLSYQACGVSSCSGYTNTIFSDGAAQTTNYGAAPFTGTYRPTGYLQYVYMSPAIGNPYYASLHGTISSFSALGTAVTPNGTWKLKVVDDFASGGGNVGGINNWSISFDGSGTFSTAGSSISTNYLPKSASGGLLINSQVYDNGNVGIGTNAPAAKLDVVGNALISGNIGIGTTAPAYKLDVAGTVAGASATANGVYGYSNISNNSFAGVKGINTGGTSGVGVLGVTGNGYGVRGVASQAGAYAVSGEISATTGSGTGIYGSGSGTSYAGLFDGKVQVNGNVQLSGNLAVGGTLSKQSGSFKIDHPLDPANKYLYHSFVESPDMKNIYDGNIVLDAQGEAVVVLPNWFDALNRDFRYQLTSIGAFMPVFVKEKISGNRFRIGGGTPGGEVSWMVTGIRQDKYANAHRIPVEENKAAEDRGRYLAPDVYGQPASEGIGRKRNREVPAGRR